MNLLPLRLEPGSDLRAALQAAVAGQGGAGCFVVSGIGSLSNPRLRLAAASETTCWEGPFELVSLAGTLTSTGTHLHMCIADAQGTVWGGHVVAGNIVRTTAEILLVQATGWELGRALDPRTGYSELTVQTQVGRRRLKAPRPSRPMPMSTAVVGSGTADVM